MTDWRRGRVTTAFGQVPRRRRDLARQARFRFARLVALASKSRSAVVQNCWRLSLRLILRDAPSALLRMRPGEICAGEKFAHDSSSDFLEGAGAPVVGRKFAPPFALRASAWPIGHRAFRCSTCGYFPASAALFVARSSRSS